MAASSRNTYVYRPPGSPNILRAIVPLSIVLLFGTFGFMVVQDEWGFWQSLYFTIITITTVGYGDYGLNTAGERFTAVLLLFGIVTATYALGQLVQVAVSYQLAWSQKMQKKIDQMQDHYIVCGFGRVGRTVCRHLTQSAKPFVVIEKDDDQFQQSCSQGYLSVLGAASRDEILLRAGIERASGIICAVDSDSENIVITLSARELHQGIQIISRADEEDGVKKIKRAGASHVVSPALKGADDIADWVIRPHLAEFLKASQYSENEYMFSELMIEDGSSLIGLTVREYGIRQQSLVFIAIKRAGADAMMRPGADETFQPGDVVLIVGPAEASLSMDRDAKAAEVLVGV